MNAPLVLPRASPELARLVLSVFGLPQQDSIEAQWLQSLALQQSVPPQEAWLNWLAAPPPTDFALVDLAARHRLTRVEMVAIALCCAAEIDPMVSRVLLSLQAPVGGALPTVGLAARAAQLLDESDSGGLAAHLTSLHSGTARQLGLLEVVGDAGVLVERAMRTPQAVALALAGFDSGWPEITLPLLSAVPLGGLIEQALAQLARSLKGDAPILLRSAWPRDGFAAAACLAASLGQTLVHLPPVLLPGTGAWLTLTGRIPLFALDLAPGEARSLHSIAGYEGAVILLAGPDGSVSWNHGQCAQWSLPMPGASERVDLWRAGGAPEALAQRFGHQMRLTAGRIHELAGAAKRAARVEARDTLQACDIVQASRVDAVLSLGAQAQLLPDTVADEALVLAPALRDNLDELLARCLQRDCLAQGLGLALRTRYRPGVRALFTGASGTGKTLAASWLATRLGLALYRVDLSSVVSKYIGETEKNLAQLFARADSAEVVLLFDEADALFGKRTDIKDSNDRFANQQTNYLLQRIESFDGIAILTSNSRSRFDAAFTRRLDTIIEFTVPTPEERRALWLAHLGEGHALDTTELNRVAAVCDLAGGHIRSATLMAASLAQPIRYPELRRAIQAEYTKLGRMAPGGL